MAKSQLVQHVRIGSRDIGDYNVCVAKVAKNLFRDLTRNGDSVGAKDGKRVALTRWLDDLFQNLDRIFIHPARQRSYICIPIANRTNDETE
jgi:hypothetical protein